MNRLVRFSVPKFETLVAQLRRNRLVFIGIFLLAWGLAAYIFYLRFPNNFVEPNFYAEDGRDFAANIIQKGFVGALLTTFNGYFIWGLYFVEGLGFALNEVLGGGFVQLPQAVAVASYLFLGFTAALPILLFRKQLAPAFLIVLVAASCLVPLPASDYAIVGTIGNLKWAFTYIGFLLVVYRLRQTEATYAKLLAADVGLVVCAYTNATTYLILPPLALPYVYEWWRGKVPLGSLLRKQSSWGIIAMAVLLIPQVVVVAVKGIPELPGYLDTPFMASRAVEIFVGRSFLYGIAAPVYHRLNDLLAILALVAMFAVLMRWGGRRQRPIYLLGAYTVTVATGLFVMNRPGVSAHFAGYANSGPDQFFYAQNLVVYVMVIFAIAEMTKRLHMRLRLAVPVGMLLVLILAAPKAGSWGANNAMADAVGSFADNAVTACAAPHVAEVGVQVYPVRSEGWQMRVPADLICPQASRLQRQRESLGLAPDNNHYVAIKSPDTFRQSFAASENGLNGLRVFFSTFAARLRTPYELVLYDSSCTQVLRRSKLQLGAIHDNRLALVAFDPIPDSKGRQYCFSITPQSEATTPLAIQLSRPSAYPAGLLTLDAKARDEDVVFELNYSQTRP